MGEHREKQDEGKRNETNTNYACAATVRRQRRFPHTRTQENCKVIIDYMRTSLSANVGMRMLRCVVRIVRKSPWPCRRSRCDSSPSTRSAAWEGGAAVHSSKANRQEEA